MTETAERTAATKGARAAEELAEEHRILAARLDALSGHIDALWWEVRWRSHQREELAGRLRAVAAERQRRRGYQEEEEE